MEEEGGEEDTLPVQWEYKVKKKPAPLYIPPDPQDDVKNRADSNVDISKLLTETDSVVYITGTNVQTGESEESYNGKDNEGGLSVEDLQRGFIKEVDCGEEGEKEWRKK